MTRQQLLEPHQRPFLQGFGQRVWFVYARALWVRSRLVPTRCASSSRMRISSGTASAGCVSTRLDGDLLSSALQSALLRRAPHQIGQGTGRQKYSCTSAIPWPMLVGRPGYRTRVTDSAVSVSARAPTRLLAHEFLKVEVMGRRGAPRAQCVDGLAAVAHHGAIKWDTKQSGGLARDGTQGAAAYLERAVEPYFHLLVRGRATSHGSNDAASCPPLRVASRPGWTGGRCRIRTRNP